jgi:hypothetical protein
MSDLLTRWPALDVAAKRGRLHDRFRFTPGPLANTVSAQSAKAERAGASLWLRDTSTWATDPPTQQKIANRLGWLDSPALMADSLGRLQSFA